MTKSKIDLSISIVTYNSADLVCQCLESIFGHEHTFSFEVFVVDNNSKDGSVQDIQKRFPQVCLIQNKKNWGFARATNQAIEKGRGRYMLLFNPDIFALEGSIEKLMEYMDSHPDVGIAGSRLLYPDGALQLSCRRFPTLATLFLRGTRIGDLFPGNRFLKEYLLEHENHHQDLDVDWCLGSCLMVRRKAIDEVGMLDDKYFMYYEDIDYCYRMKQKSWKITYLASTEMIHHYQRKSASIPPNRYTLIHLKSAFYFFWKFWKERGFSTIL